MSDRIEIDRRTADALLNKVLAPIVRHLGENPSRESVFEVLQALAWATSPLVSVDLVLRDWFDAALDISTAEVFRAIKT